ncbi:hypothetical protein [Paenibacillus jilunlii]|nr:hypothetical protein [Paenibacillus jilunlii]
MDWVKTILAAVGLMISSPYPEAAVQNAIYDDNRVKVFFCSAGLSFNR